ncbi:UNVERIFIED_CONTAM: Increased DNA methylation 1 [Sesamum angustifolium]|uniref:Increased DNA methylation 1 n=1 Tax=Sesamum angustifolium TaxID=2727405 RepID=A0AAW2N4X1_9LAMI
MKPELGVEIECSGQLKGSEPESGSSDPARPDSTGSDWMDRCYVPRIRPSEANGFAVYTRNKRLKSRGVDRIGHLDKLQGDAGVLVKAADAVSSNVEVVVSGSGAVNVGADEGSLGNSGFRGGESEGEMMEVEVKEDPMALVAVRSDGLRRFTRSVLKSKDEDSEMENEDSGDLTETVILEADGIGNEKLTVLGNPKTRKMEMKMSKKILIKGRPTTVRELFETGLLEGYPVFYNGGKRGFPLRGTIKDAGILCSCSLCKGARVVPPCQFEIHACKSYRRASQYICLENGKSLLDVVKECRKSSVKTLEETIQNFIGPMPVKESVICRNCEGSFLATSAAKAELLCDSCMITLNSDFDAECVKSRPLEPLLGLPMPENGEVHSTPQKRAVRRETKLRIYHYLSHFQAFRADTSYEISWKTLTAGCNKEKRPMEADENVIKCCVNSKSLKSGSPSGSEQSKSSLKITKKDQRMHKLVFENGALPDGTEVAYYSNGKKLRDGYKMGSGIICHCCSKMVSPSQFEAHAGWASRRKPYMYIYTSNGVSLHEFAISLLKGRKYSSKDNDDLCTICADGGKLVLCDGCPRAFHKECASLSSIPRGKWYCTYCQNIFQREKFVKRNANAVAAGRVSGIDPIAQITDRCIRIVKNPEEAEVIACVICRGYDFSKSGFGPRTVILCDQKKETEKTSVADTDFDVRWRLLNGKIMSRETRVLLSQAVAIFHDCFDPIVDSETGRDFIPSLAYGEKYKGSRFQWNVLCYSDREVGTVSFSHFTLAIDNIFFLFKHFTKSCSSIVVSAGILRIFGQEIAELPLAATRIGNQGKGYFQVLYSCIEKLLAFLNVKSFVLPATDEAKSIWTEKFGFKRIPQEQLFNYRKTCWQMITFKGTSMLEKAVPKCRIINNEEGDGDVPLQ